MVYALLIDDVDGMVDRYDVREKWDTFLDAPLGDPDDEQVREYHREKWGTSREAVRDAAKFDSFMPTFGEPDGEDDGAEEWDGVS